jgi:murein DD-endopeptidase MepM/ murein hydrolase activator NlpD
MLMQVLVAFALAAAVVLFGHLAMPAAGPAGTPAAAVQAPGPAAAPVAREAAPTARPAVRVHTVAAGESLSAIAARYAIDVDTLLGANPEADELIHPGDELVVLPQKGALHVVAAGDTLWALSRAYGVGVAAIQAANGREGDALAVGERLFIPGGRPRGEAVSRAYGQRFAWPAAGEITSPFGYRWGRHHAGIDIAAEAGSPVRAARAGRVAFAGWYGGYGYTVMIEHGQGIATLYAHLDDYVVEGGQHVAAGQRLGYVGDTGYSFGAHLHFEVRVNGQPVNPLQFLP